LSAAKSSDRSWRTRPAGFPRWNRSTSRPWTRWSSVCSPRWRTLRDRDRKHLRSGYRRDRRSHRVQRGHRGMSDSFHFYDLETWGTDPRRTRIAQFAAIRTDVELRELGEPIDFLVRPANDLLPSPGASMVTGLAPQDTLVTGLSETEAFARIVDEMGHPG